MLIQYFAKKFFGEKKFILNIEDELRDAVTKLEKMTTSQDTGKDTTKLKSRN